MSSSTPNADSLSDEPSKLYPPGTVVWAKTLDTIWWPGFVVNLEDTPEEFKTYVFNKKKNYKIIVCYDTDKTHDAIINLNKLMKYDCPNKIDFITKGYLLYEKEKKSGIKKSGICMENFIKDVKVAEKATGSNVNVLDDIIKEIRNKAEKELKLKELSKSLFVEKTKKRSLEQKSKGTTPELQKRLSGFSNSNQLRKSYTPSMVSNGMVCCHGRCGKNNCRASFNSSILVNFHIEEVSNPKLNKTKSPKNRRQSQSSIVKTKKTSNNNTTQPEIQSTQNLAKKKKTDSKRVQEEILNDWCDDENDQDETLEENVENNVSSVSDTIFDFDDTEDNNSASIENLRHVKNASSNLVNSEVNNENPTVLKDDNVVAIVEKKNTVDDSSVYPMGVPDFFKANSWDTRAPGFYEALSSSETTINIEDLDSVTPTENYECAVSKDIFEDDKEMIYKHITEPELETVKIVVPNTEHKCLSDEDLIKHPLYIEAVKRLKKGQVENLFVLRTDI